MIVVTAAPRRVALVSAAREAGAVAVGVATGTSRPGGADVLLDDLTAFASWLVEASTISVP